MARFQSRFLFNFPGDVTGDSADRYMPEIINVTVFQKFFLADGLGSLGNHDDGIVYFPASSFAQKFADFIHIKRMFRYQNDVGAAAFPATQGQPSGMTSHGFHHKDAAVGTGGCSQTVDFFHNNIYRRVKTERIFRSRQIHIYCFGNTDRFYTHFVQLVSHAQRVFSADSDNGVDAKLFNVFQ